MVFIAVYEALLKEYCSFEHDRRCLSDKLIDTACLDVPKIALVATLASRCPAEPFVFRNYELPLATEAERRSMGFMDGSSKHAVWQAVRASSGERGREDFLLHSRPMYILFGRTQSHIIISLTLSYFL